MCYDLYCIFVLIRSWHIYPLEVATVTYKLPLVCAGHQCSIQFFAHLSLVLLQNIFLIWAEMSVKVNISDLSVIDNIINL